MNSWLRSQLRVNSATSQAALLLASGFAVGLWSLYLRPPNPTGLDGGNWLAFGHALFGEDAKSTLAAYPPLVPFSLVVLSQISSPLASVTVLAAMTSAAVFVAVAAALRGVGLNLYYSLCAAAMVVLSGPINEAKAFGGYPQNLSVALGIVALSLGVRFVHSGSPRAQLGAATALAASAACHHMYFVVALSSFLVLALTISLRRERGSIVKPLVGLAAVGSVGIAAFFPTYEAMRDLGYSAPINPVNWSFQDALAYGLRPATFVWLGLICVGLFWLISHARNYHRDPMWTFTFSLLLPVSVAFLATGEPRLLPFMIIGGVGAFTRALDEIGQWSFECEIASRLAPPILIVLLVPSALRFNESLANYYTALDPPAIETIHWLSNSSDDGAAAVASIRQGWPIGWWFAGLSSRRIVVQSDERWIAFPKEVAESRLVDRLLYNTDDSHEACTLASTAGIRFLVFRQAEWEETSYWTDGPDPQFAEAVFYNSEYSVLRFRQDCGR